MNLLRLVLRAIAISLMALVAIEGLLQGAAVWAQHAYRRSEVVATGRIRILCLGDSNTYGLYLAAQESWPSQLQQVLERQTPGRYQVVNLGFPGTPTSRIAQNLDAFLGQFSPTIVVVMAGVNDLIYGAVDATDSSQRSALEKLRAFTTTNVRTYRAWLLWRRGREQAPKVANDIDSLSSGLLTLQGQSDEGALAILARLYRERGFTVRVSGMDYWLDYEGTSVKINDALDTFRHGDLYALTMAYINLPISAGMDLRDWDLHAGLQVDGKQFEMRPVRNSGGQDGDTVARNLRFIAQGVVNSGARFILATYASNQHYYGQANQVVRRLARTDGLELVDVEPEVTASCKDSLCSEMFFPDYHPTGEGYRLVAARLADYLAP